MISKRKVLFVCNQNKNRSKTAEELFRGQYDTKSAGLYNESNKVSREQIVWADVIIVFEDMQKEEILSRFPKECWGKHIIDLMIPDLFDYNTLPLVTILKERMSGVHVGV